MSQALRGEQELTRGNVCMEGHGSSAVLTEGDIMGLWTPERRSGADYKEGRGNMRLERGWGPTIHSLVIPGKDFGPSSKSHGTPLKGFKRESGRVTRGSLLLFPETT